MPINSAGKINLKELVSSAFMNLNKKLSDYTDSAGKEYGNENICFS